MHWDFLPLRCIWSILVGAEIIDNIERGGEWLFRSHHRRYAPRRTGSGKGVIVSFYLGGVGLSSNRWHCSVGSVLVIAIRWCTLSARSGVVVYNRLEHFRTCIFIFSELGTHILFHFKKSESSSVIMNKGPLLLCFGFKPRPCSFCSIFLPLWAAAFYHEVIIIRSWDSHGTLGE
jgi:hypothetical protein